MILTQDDGTVVATISGSVTIAGTVAVSNFPATQPVAVTSQSANLAVEAGGYLQVIGSNTNAVGLASDAAVSDANGSLNAHLRGIVKILADVWDTVAHMLKVRTVPSITTAVDVLTALTVPAATANTDTVVYTVPAGRIAIVRSSFLNVQTGTTAAGQVNLNLRVGRNLVHNAISAIRSIVGSATSITVPHEIVLRAGDTVVTRYSNADINPIAITVFAVIDEVTL